MHQISVYGEYVYFTVKPIFFKCFITIAVQNKHPDSKFRDGNLRIKCNVFVFFVCLFVSSALCMYFSYDSRHFCTGTMDWIILWAEVLCEDNQDSSKENQQQSWHGTQDS